MDLETLWVKNTIIKTLHRPVALDYKIDNKVDRFNWENVIRAKI